MSISDSQPSFVAVNASVLTGPVATVPAPVFAPPEPPPLPAPAPKSRNLNDGRKWLAALLLITATGGATAIVLNPALRPSSLAWSSESTTAHDQTPVQIPPPPAAPLAASAVASILPAQPQSPPVDNPRPSPSDDAHLLWQYALNAESHRDFATAVKLYERLESLPNTDWPPGLHTRLRLAQQELVAGLH
jgi:hypothetical protein